MNKYINTIAKGFNDYGLNGFYEIHSDVCRKISTPWEGEMKCLNDLNFDQFESLCKFYFKYKN